MFEEKSKDHQNTIWTVSADIVKGPGHAYYQKLEKALEEANFAGQIRDICAPYYVQDISRGGRKGIDPYVYFKMLMVGFFENIGSERGIASRCADSLSIRGFLKYELTEYTPDHSSLSRIRTRLGTEVFQEAFQLILEILQKHNLLKGKQVGIDTSVIEANASMRTLVNNHTGETYDEYVKRLAKESGLDPENKSAVRNFDKKRKDKKMSNDDWHGPNDSDAKIGPTKQGDIQMIHKTEHIVDMESGAIIQTSVLPGDQPDGRDVSEHIEKAREVIEEVKGSGPEDTSIQILTGDKGYFNLEELEKLQQEKIKTVIEDRAINRNLEKLSTSQQKTIKNARRSVRSQYGKKIKKRRGEYLERSFTHVLDNGDLRRSTLSGRENIQKRNLIGCLCCNLSLFMRKTYGFGTLKQYIAAVGLDLSMLLELLRRICGAGVYNTFRLICTGRLEVSISQPEIKLLRI